MSRDVRILLASSSEDAYRLAVVLTAASSRKAYKPSFARRSKLSKSRFNRCSVPTTLGPRSWRHPASRPTSTSSRLLWSMWLSLSGSSWIISDSCGAGATRLLGEPRPYAGSAEHGELTCGRCSHRSILARFTNTLVRLKPLASIVSKQLLLDLQEIKSILLDLPRYSLSEEGSASAAAS